MAALKTCLLRGMPDEDLRMRDGCETYMRPPLLACLVLVVATACGRSMLGHTNLELCADCVPTGAGDATEAAPTWAAYIETLPAEPPCATGVNPPLVVNTADFTVDGPRDPSGVPSLSDPAEAGATLSLAEAGWIAMNRTGAEVIVFDPQVFPTAQSTVIRVSEAELPDQFGEVCIDGRGAGVVVDFAAIPEDCLMPCALNLNQGRLVGLDLQGNREPHQLSNSHVALTRIGAIGRPFWAFGTCTIGPHNVIIGGSDAIIDRMATVEVSGSYWGYDPTTARTLGTAGLFSWNNRTIVRDNVIAGQGGWALGMRADDTANRLQLRDNWFGLDHNGQALNDAYSLIALLPLDLAQIDVGPNNRFEAEAVVSVTCSAQASVHVSGNPGLHGGQYMAQGPGTTPLPTLDTRTADGVGGTCYDNGVLELLRVLENDDRVSLGTTTCSLGGSWQIATPLESGQLLVATMTAFPGCTSPPGAPWRVP